MASINVTANMPFAVLSFFVFNAIVKAAAFASNAKLIIAVSNELLWTTTFKKSMNADELAFHK